MLTTTDIYLCSLIGLFLMIPVLTVIFCVKQRELKFRRILFSFSFLILILGIGIIGNYNYLLRALKESPIIGVAVFFFIILTIGSLLTGYQEILSIRSSSNTLIWTKRSLHQAIKNYKSVPDIFSSSRERITNIIEYSPISVLILDKKLEIVGFNTAFLNFIGYKKREVIALDLVDIFCSEQKEENDLQQILKEYRKHKIEFIRKLRKKDGGTLYGKLIVYYIKDDSRADGYHLIIQILDMTREVELQKKTREFNTLLQERVTKQTQILSKKNKNLEYLNHAMSHDLKAPIKNLEGLFDVYLELNKISDENDRQSCAKHIQLNIKRMDKIITDLSLFFHTQKKEILKVAYNPTAQIKEIIEIYAKGLYSNLRIESKIDKLPMLYADRDVLFHVLQNLILNAIKYASKKEVVRLHISGYHKEGRTVLSIQDNGIGFSIEEKDFLFQPFKRLTNSKEYSGTGLGLPIAKEIIDRHGGEIWAKSTPGKRSIFYFSLPKKETISVYGQENYNDLLSQKGIEKNASSLLEEINNTEKLIFGKAVKK